MRRPLAGEFDKSGNGNRFAGAYVSSGRLLPLATAEPYVFYRRDTNQRAESGSFGSLDQVTIGGRLAGKLPARLDYNVEMDLQRGSLGADSVRAGLTRQKEVARPDHECCESPPNTTSPRGRGPVDGTPRHFDRSTAAHRQVLLAYRSAANIHDFGRGGHAFKATPINVNSNLCLA